jgi:hypothetical protein
MLFRSSLITNQRSAPPQNRKASSFGNRPVPSSSSRPSPPTHGWSKHESQEYKIVQRPEWRREVVKAAAPSIQPPATIPAAAAMPPARSAVALLLAAVLCLGGGGDWVLDNQRTERVAGFAGGQALRFRPSRPMEPDVAAEEGCACFFFLCET